MDATSVASSKQSSVTRHAVLSDAAEDDAGRFRQGAAPPSLAASAAAREKLRQQLYGLFTDEVLDVQRNVEQLQERLGRLRISPSHDQARGSRTSLSDAKPGAVLTRGPPPDVVEETRERKQGSPPAPRTSIDPATKRHVDALFQVLRNSHHQRRSLLQTESRTLDELSRTVQQLAGRSAVPGAGATRRPASARALPTAPVRPTLKSFVYRNATTTAAPTNRRGMPTTARSPPPQKQGFRTLSHQRPPTFFAEGSAGLPVRHGFRQVPVARSGQ